MTTNEQRAYLQGENEGSRRAYSSIADAMNSINVSTRKNIEAAVDEIAELWWMRSEVPCSEQKKECLRAILTRHIMGEGVPGGSPRIS